MEEQLQTIMGCKFMSFLLFSSCDLSQCLCRGYSSVILKGGRGREVSHFENKLICNFPYPISDLTQIL